MSVETESGDQGTTGLMYGRRVAKWHPRLEALGAVDELNTALGLARAAAQDKWLRDAILAIQLDLVRLMGELATDPADLPRYLSDGFQLVTPELTAKLDRLGAQFERPNAGKGWTMPGENLAAAALEAARATCRRAERRVCALQAGNELPNVEIIAFLNRLADVLWLMARRVAKPLT
jgi:cob(I)alamin adenosyltransferase